MGNQNTDSVNLAFAFTTTSTTRSWEIKVILNWNLAKFGQQISFERRENKVDGKFLLNQFEWLESFFSQKML